MIHLKEAGWREGEKIHIHIFWLSLKYHTPVKRHQDRFHANYCFSSRALYLHAV